MVQLFSPRIRTTIKKSRLLFASIKSHQYCHTPPPPHTEATAEEIIRVLSKHNNWQFLLESSHIPTKLSSDVVQSVLQRSHFSTHPMRLLDFFNWSNQHLGTPQTLDSFSILTFVLCGSNLYAPAINVLGRMVDARVSVSDGLSSMNSIVYNGGPRFRSRPVAFELLIDVYRKRAMWNECVCVFLGVKDCDFRISLLCCNSLLKDLLRCNRMELFWKVYGEMSVKKIESDAYTYVSVITAHCRVGNVMEAKRVLSEMGERGCEPNVIAYNVVVRGLCGVGAFDEALELKTTMAENG
ncbi:hypothetical protein ACP275_09G084300 [Erythranthe tilingii]